jgi:hypothetical protein
MRWNSAVRLDVRDHLLERVGARREPGRSRAASGAAAMSWSFSIAVTASRPTSRCMIW